MRTCTMTRWAGLCATVAGCVLSVARVSAEEGEETAAPADLATLQRRLDDLEKQVASNPGNTQTCCDPCPCPGFTFGAEMAMLKFHENVGAAEGYGDWEPAPRIWAGWTTAGGLGIRFRWFDYQDSNADSVIERVRLYTVDAEVTDSFQLGSKWSGLFSGGVRYGENNEITEFGMGGTRRLLDCGVGPVVGVELNRRVTDHISLFAVGRESLLFGNVVSDEVVPVRVSNTCFSISEIQLGGEWRRPFNGCAYFFARTAVEAQWWGGSQTSAPAYFDGYATDVGLVGATVSIGICR